MKTDKAKQEIITPKFVWATKDVTGKKETLYV